MVDTITMVLGLLAGAGIAGVGFLLMSKKSSKQDIVQVKPSLEGNQEIESAKNEAKQIILDAKDEAIKVKEEAEKDTKETKARLDEVYNKIKEIEQRENNLNQQKGSLDKKTKEVEDLKQEQIRKLEEVSSLTKEEAKNLMLQNLEKTLSNEVAKKIKESEEEIATNVDQKSKEILVDAMHSASTDYVAEYTISTVKLSDKDIKGRIIGKEGRNIKAFEDITGVNVDFEDETEVRLSSFDSVRREVARLSMEKLLKDGRIHPARIEEVVKKTQSEVDKIILEAGERLCQEVGVYNLPKELVSKLGHFKFRTSYGQNMIQHTLEETKMGSKIANEIGANVTITKLACLLHDIGKVITDKDGNHIELGAQYLKKFNLPSTVISAVAEHHDDKPSTVEGVIVQIADSISGSRPGARYEDFENFVKRMRDLETTATSFDGVEKAYAISAGRELRVIVKPEDIADSQAVNLSHQIAKKIESEQTFPGTVKVIVIRETRSVSTAT